MRNVLNTVKSRSWCYLILELAVLSSFLGFTIFPGSLGDLMHICGGIFLLNVIAGNYRLKDLTVGHFFALALFSIILLINLFMPEEMIHRRSVRYFLASPWLIFAIHCLYVNRDKIISRLPKEIYSSAVLFAVLFQFIAYHFDIKNESWGNYSNPHHLGNFVSMTIPLLFYFLAESKGLHRTVFAFVLLIDTYLLWETRSGVAWFALFSGIFLASVLFLKPKQIFIGIVGFLIVAIAGAFLSGLTGVEDRLLDLVTNLHKESRLVIWADTLKLLQDNSISDWFFGHGIGSFRYSFEPYSTYISSGHKISFPFPHNTPLQLIFENGLIGFLIIFGSLGFLLVALRWAYHVTKDQKDRHSIITVFALMLINLIFTGLTYSFYKKYSIYPWSLICGAALILLEKSSLNKPWPSSKLYTWYQKINFSRSKL